MANYIPINATDRVPSTGKANRKKIIFEDDNSIRYAKVENADDPVNIGTKITSVWVNKLDKKIITSDVYPNITPNTGDIWVDSSLATPRLKYWTGNAWREIGNTNKTVIEFITSGAFVAPYTGIYDVICVGRGGNGGSGASATSRYAGSGGGGGGVAYSRLNLIANTSYAVTASSIASFSNLLSATAGGNGSGNSKNEVAGGVGGTATGGNISNITGGKGANAVIFGQPGESTAGTGGGGSGGYSSSSSREYDGGRGGSGSLGGGGGGGGAAAYNTDYDYTSKGGDGGTGVISIASIYCGGGGGAGTAIDVNCYGGVGGNNNESPVGNSGTPGGDIAHGGLPGISGGNGCQGGSGGNPGGGGGGAGGSGSKSGGTGGCAMVIIVY